LADADHTTALEEAVADETLPQGTTS